MSDTIEKVDATTTDPVPTPQAGVVGTDFLTFAVGGGANVESQADYQADPQRPTGNLPGIARSNFNNKALRQGTFVAHSLCLWISQQLTQYIPDDGNDIAWIGEWTQALSNYMLALIPPGPNLGAYLPLAGGTMSGNIQFVSGVSTVLANNTWYYARDTGGTQRGLILKGSDNNITINDGTSQYVFFHGTPSLDNNVSWGGKTTGGTPMPVAGLLSDNCVHIGGGSAGHIYLDCSGGGSVWVTSNIVIPNMSSYYGKDTAGAARAIMGMDNGNKLLIGQGGHAGSTDIYGNGGIYLHNQTVALTTFVFNTYAYLNGGGRIYIPGGHDPLQIYSDPGFYARIHYIVGNTRDWTMGCENNGAFGIADESAAAMRVEIDTGGGFHIYGGLSVSGQIGAGGGIYGDSLTAYHGASISGGLTVQNGLNVASGNLTINGGTYTYGGLQVWNGLTINSGNFVAAGAGQINNGLTVYNNFNMASGTTWLNGPVNMYSTAYIAGSAYVQGRLTTPNTQLVYMYDNNGVMRLSFAIASGPYNQYYADFHVWYSTWNEEYAYFYYGGCYNVNGGWGAFSSRELKTNIQPYLTGLAAIRGLNPVTFDYIEGAPFSQKPRAGVRETVDPKIGLIADEVEPFVPEIVGEVTVPHNGSEITVSTLTPILLTYSMINAIKELADRLEALEAAGAA